jgi:predicted small metal-binding protein
MAKVINCECGFVARSDSDEKVVAVIREHMATDHPDLLASVDVQDLYGWIQQE